MKLTFSFTLISALMTLATVNADPFFPQADNNVDALKDVPSTPPDPQPMQDDDLEYNFCPEKGELRSQIPPISQISASIALHQANTPRDCAKDVFTDVQTATALRESTITYHWQPTNFFHQPLYFDDTPLERYGQSLCPRLQPVISGVRFFATIPVVPYKIGIDRPYDCVSTLGYYRPGACAPCTRERFAAWEADAALLEAGTALLLIFAFP